jgi:hypothetical protein
MWHPASILEEGEPEVMMWGGGGGLKIAIYIMRTTSNDQHANITIYVQ